MTAAHVIIVLAVGACIGYVTNFIAVKMLFRPYKPVMIGKFRIPLTPGVIPKNRERIAKACGKAIEGSLLTADDIMGAFDVDSLAEKAAGSISLDMRIDTLVTDESLDRIEEEITEKLAAGVKALDLRSFIIDRGGKAIMDKISGSMLAMFVTPSMIESFADPICTSIYDYLDNEGKVRIQELVTDEVEAIAKKTVAEELTSFKIDYRALVFRAVKDFAENGAESLMPQIDVSGIVESKINSMDIREFEQLVLSVMKRELQAVINLGALIGLVIGLINLAVL